MTTVTGTLTVVGGGFPAGAAVVLTLVDLEGAPTLGFTETAEVAGSVTAVVSPVDGTWSTDVTPTDDIVSPRGFTLYRVEEHVPGVHTVPYHISVPDSGTYNAPDLLVSLPGAVDNPAGYLPLAGGTMTGTLTLNDGSPAASQDYVAGNGGGGGGGTPADTVTASTSYGQAPSAGAASTYARGDHTHGSPTAPTAAAIGAATSGHLHSGVYDPAGTASAAVSAHAGVSDPHPQYLTTAEADATYEAKGAMSSSAVFPLLEGYGLLAAPGDPLHWLNNSSVSDGVTLFSRVWIPAGVTITNLWIPVRTAGTHDGSSSPNQIGLYDVDGTLVDATADDPTLWTASGWRGGALQSGPAPAQDTGRWVYLTAIAHGVSGAAWPMPTQADDTQTPWFDHALTGAARRGFYLGGQATLPASVDPASSGTVTTFLPFIGVS